MKSILFSLIIFLTIAARKFTDKLSQPDQASHCIPNSFGVHDDHLTTYYFYDHPGCKGWSLQGLSGPFTIIKEKTPAYGPAFSSDGSGHY